MSQGAPFTRPRRPCWARAISLVALFLASSLLTLRPVETGSAAGVSTGDGAWTWQNPGPQGNDLHAIRFADASTGWAVGKGGVILRTQDGGETWNIQRSGTQNALFGLAVRDAGAAVAVGPGGLVLTTADGGATWTRRTGADNAFLLAVQYVDPTTLYAIGQDRSAVRSQDGGATWERVAWNPPNLGNANWRAFQFLDPATGYLLADGPRLYATGDAGGSWRQLDLSAAGNRALRALAFANPAHGVLVGDGGLLLQTTDGGATWATPDVPTAADLYGAAFGDANTVHVFGDGVVLKSTDGGANWALFPGEPPSTEKLVNASFVDAATGYVAGFAGTLLKTADAGDTWTKLERGPRGTLRAVHFASPEIGVAVGERGVIFKTADRGSTWRAVRSGTARDLNAVQFFSRQTAIAAGDGGTILRSDDGGESWRAIPSPVGMNLRAISLAGDPDTGRLDVGVLVGDTGLVLRSVDGGSTWIEVRLPGPPDQLFAVRFPEPRIGYIGGLRTIWQTGDGGRTWRIVAGTGATPRDPLGFSFPSVNRGYAVGVNGQIFRTADGGTTWTALSSGTQRTLRAVQFVDEQTGYVVGDEGTILATGNGGATWRSVNSGTHLSLRGLNFVNRALGLAVGEGGAVLKTTSGGLPTRAAPPAIVEVSPAANQTNVRPDVAVRLTFNKEVPLDPAQYGENGVYQLRDVAGRLVPASVAWDAINQQAVLRPAQSLAAGTVYNLLVVGGEEGLADAEGRRMVYDFRTSFRTTCPGAVAGGFGKLLALDRSFREKIGCPQAAERPVPAVEQVFESGHMLSRSDSRQVIVTYFDTGRWEAFPDTFQKDASLAPLSPPEGLVAPERAFGKLWRDQGSVRDRLGWALGPERVFEGALQDFGGGFTVWTGIDQWLIRAYYADGTTLVVPDPNTPPNVTETPAGYQEQPSFTGACSPTPSGSVCLSFDDGYVWLVNDAVLGREERDTWQGRKIIVVLGQRSNYYHILGTRFVKQVPATAPPPRPV